MKTKTRLTITLAPDILRQVDELIDGQSVRNRSHAIETLLKQSLGSGCTTAVLLAGGQQSHIPSLMQFQNRLVLSHTLEYLKRNGFSRVIICAGANEAAIRGQFGDGTQLGIRLLYAQESQPLGTAGALKNAEALIAAEQFLVLNDTVVTDISLSDVVALQQQEGTMATMCVKPRLSEKKYGQAFLHGNTITKFLDSTDETQGISIVNMGVYVFRSDIFKKIPANTYLNLETDIFPQLATQAELSAFVYQGFWHDVLTQQEKNS